MNGSPADHCRLTSDACRSRQRRLAARLTELGFDGALFASRTYVYYFSGFWPASYHTPLLLLSADGSATLVAPQESIDESPAVDEIIEYGWQQLGTIVDGSSQLAFGSITPRIREIGRLAIDQPLPRALDNGTSSDIGSILLEMRRAKDADEVALVRRAIHGCEAAYSQAIESVRPGIREIDVYAEIQAAVVRSLGTPIGELGNDFQAGTGGGPPRSRRIQAGELMPLDVSVNFRGYRCDLCRTFVVGGEPSDAQQRAADLVVAALELVERSAREGVSARWLYDEARAALTNEHGWEFPHHLGHGIGLGIHEAPRLNPHWDDVLTAGDLFTIEPGLYGDQLQGGVRIEDNYWIGHEGLTKLSSFPRGLAYPRTLP